MSFPFAFAFEMAFGYEVQVIPQLHFVKNTAKFKDLLADTALSQFEIIQELKRHPNAAVFVEGVYEDKSNSNLDPNFILKAKTLFTSGVPSDFAKLSQDQIDFLARNRAAQVAVALGIIERAYKTPLMPV